jgi:hypothetical protein
VKKDWNKKQSLSRSVDSILMRFLVPLSTLAAIPEVDLRWVKSTFIHPIRGI